MWRWLWNRLRADDAAGMVTAEHAMAESGHVTVLYAKVTFDGSTPPAPQSPSWCNSTSATKWQPPLDPEIGDPKRSVSARTRQTKKGQDRTGSGLSDNLVPSPLYSGERDRVRVRGQESQESAAPSPRPSPPQSLERKGVFVKPLPFGQDRVRRFTRRFTDMAPREARLLFAVYRRTVKSLAIESPAVLQRDLHRFVLSSRGQRISRGQAAPSIARVRTWVIESREMITVSSAVVAKRPANLAR